MSTTFDFGNRTITASISGGAAWDKDGMARTYFDLTFDGAKLAPIAKLYEVLSGATRDESFQIDGRTFAFQAGIAADSKTKRRAVAEAARALAQEVAA